MRCISYSSLIYLYVSIFDVDDNDLKYIIKQLYTIHIIYIYIVFIIYKPN
jgi:hypothetical protein